MRKGEFPLIFIIEDNPLFLKMIEENLKKNKLSNFKSFTNVEDCIDDIYANPDIVIMDYELGNMDGLDLINMIKNRISNPYMIMLTQSEDIGIALKALQGGAYDYIHKDEISFKLLKSIIEKIIEDHNAGVYNTTNTDMTGFKRFLKT